MADSSGTSPQAAKPWALVLAAGQGNRMAESTGGTAKQFLPWRGVPLFWHAARAMSSSACVAGIVFVFPASQIEQANELLADLQKHDDLGLPWVSACGGALRQDSVRLGLAALPVRPASVLVHDAARPFLTPALVRSVCHELAQGAAGVIPAISVTDTIKTVENGRVTATLPRDGLAAVQTPQGFQLQTLLDAHAHALEAGLAVTDDASLLEALGFEVRVIQGEAANVKITRPEDLDLLRDETPLPSFRTGMGYDVHRYGQGRPMRLGGVSIPNAPEVLAHSDGDVLLHALSDALLGCACLADIGQHFSDKDARFEGISSAILLHQVLDMVREAGCTPCHVDMTIVAQVPKLAPYREEIRKNVARLMGLPASSVNLKATTEEHLGFTGRSEGIKAYAVVTARGR
jgi:2-C-methyl-D-erythritol 4-phosphate cytidylyltransferase / 2-C-methyl-D-erythritol 2,4-cyclodiphosphate synthase